MVTDGEIERRSSYLYALLNFVQSTTEIVFRNTVYR